MNIDDDAIIKRLVEQIIVNDDGIEIQFKCGAAITKEYEAASTKPSAVDKTIIEGVFAFKVYNFVRVPKVARNMFTKPIFYVIMYA